jgi:hypothetical protein
MFGVEKRRLVEGLEEVRRALCCYAPGSTTVCDCKFGAEHVGDKAREQSGCPELRQATHILKAIPNWLYRLLCIRAKILVWYGGERREVLESRTFHLGPYTVYGLYKGESAPPSLQVVDYKEPIHRFAWTMDPSKVKEGADGEKES